MTSSFTIAYSTHRLESLPLAQAEMQRHQAIVLEEPSPPDLGQVFRGEKSVTEYLWESETEFPEFSRQQVMHLQELWHQGKVILQLEPYLARLQTIHDLLAQGQSPAAVEAREDLREVYRLERQATAALLDFYRIALGEDFAAVVAAVKQFAYIDARRFRYRDQLRAQALAALAGTYTAIYVEAGYLHLALPGELRRRLPAATRVKTLYLLAAKAKEQGRRFLPFGPGDSLTLAYIFRRPLAPEEEDLLAARSLIYIKLLSKDEAPEHQTATPHLNEELTFNLINRRLSYQDCGRLYPLVRSATPKQAQKIVHRFLRAKRGF